jgi:hypothetical protein
MLECHKTPRIRQRRTIETQPSISTMNDTEQRTRDLAAAFEKSQRPLAAAEEKIRRLVEQLMIHENKDKYSPRNAQSETSSTLNTIENTADVVQPESNLSVIEKVSADALFANQGMWFSNADPTEDINDINQDSSTHLATGEEVIHHPADAWYSRFTSAEPPSQSNCPTLISAESTETSTSSFDSSVNDQHGVAYVYSAPS